jgi:hypothetical protein
VSSTEVPSVALSAGGGEFPVLAAGDRVHAIGTPHNQVGEVISVLGPEYIGWAYVRWPDCTDWALASTLRVVSYAR